MSASVSRTKLTVRFDKADGIPPEEARLLTKDATAMQWGDLFELSDRYKAALEMFDNRRKLAHSLRAESPQVAAFVEAIGVEMDKILKPKAQT
jgi:hypothetical protein